MKILNFAIIIILNLLNKLRYTWHLIVTVENSFKSIAQKTFQQLHFSKTTMDQNQEQPREEEAPPQQADQMEPERDEDDQDEPMDEDDLMDDDDLDAELDIEFSSTSSDSESETEGNYISKWQRRLKLHAVQYVSYKSPLRPMYTFQPLRLIKRNYKIHNSGKSSLESYPTPRSGHRIIASESHLYSLGGYNPATAVSAARRGQCVLFQELWSYNFATNSWKLQMDAGNASNMPKELASNALAIHNNVLISHGGTGYPFGESCSNDCYIYTTGDTPIVSRLKVTGDLPTAQYGPGIVLHKDYLYTIGGTTGYDYSCDVYRLNLTTKVWENVYNCRPELRDDPEGRYRHEVVYDGHHIYVLGGGTSHSVYDLQRIPAFNLNTNRWDYIDTLPDRTVIATTSTAAAQQDAGFPKPRKCFSCVQNQTSNGDIEAFITGGLQGDFTTYFSDVWKLNLRTRQWAWIRTASLPRPLYFHSAAHDGTGCMYIFGGIEYNEKKMRRRNNLYKMWMTIPKLSEMCWDAITFYNENLDDHDRQKLLKGGIPKRFAERISVNTNKNKQMSISPFMYEF